MYHDREIRGLGALRPVRAQSSVRDGMVSTTTGGMPNLGAAGMQGIGPARFQDGGMVSPAMSAPLADMAAAPMGQPGQQALVQIVQEAELALAGQHPNPERAIAAFVETFGQQKLEELAASVMAQGDNPRLVRGPGGPQDDKVPARIEEVEEARLSDGEFVMTADAVAGIGEGDPIIGAQRLQRLNEMFSGKRENAGLNVEKVS